MVKRIPKNKKVKKASPDSSKEKQLIDLESEEETEQKPENLNYDKFCKGPYLLLIKFKMGIRTVKWLSPIEITRKLSKANIKFDSMENHSYNTWKLFFNSRSEANQTIKN